MNLSDLAADDGDLPDFPAKPAQPRDPATQRFAPKPPSQAAAPPEQPKPAHSPYFETTARQFGFSDADLLATPPAVLEKVVAQLQAQRATSPKAEEPPAKPAPEELFDWGTDEHGKPLTEAQAKERYDPPVFRAIKAANEVEVLKRENAELKAGFEKDRQERSQRAALRQINAVFATRPDLFGDNPGEAKPGTPEAARYRAAVRHIEDLLAAKQHTTPKQDAEAALQLWGPAPKGKAKPAAQSGAADSRLAQYQDAELATPTLRRGSDAPMSYRDRLVQKHRDAAIANGAVPNAGWDADDDSDLPD